MLLVQVSYKLYEQHPDLFKLFHKAALEDTILALSNSKGNTRTLDTRKNKSTEWKMIMMLREVWNAAQGVYIANQPQKSNVVNIKPATTYNNLFNTDNKNTGTDDDI
jgi:asparagine N-glycosylation enzyme membrane subunit Stt3